MIAHEQYFRRRNRLGRHNEIEKSAFRFNKPEPPATTAQYIKSANNLKQIGIAIHNYHDVNERFPAYFLTKAGKPGLSWRVAILPFIEEGELFKQFKLDEPWDSENNKKLIEKLPKTYAPVRGKADKGQTFYQMFVGRSTMLAPEGTKVSFSGVTDGLSNTIMVVEGAKPVIWTKPDDLPFDGKTVPDHTEQYRAMGTLHYAELRQFWERERARRVKLEQGNN